MTTRSLATIVFAIAFSAQAFAGTVGSLSWDGTSNYITDSADPTTQYVQLGLYADLNYSQTVSALSTELLLSGFHIATQTDAYKFYNSLGGTPYRDILGRQSKAHYLPYYQDGALGYDYYTLTDAIFFLADEGQETGFLSISKNNFYGKYITDYYRTIQYTDRYSQAGLYPDLPISWLLVNDNVLPTPIPAAAFMFAPALLGLLGFRRKLRA